MSGEKLMKFGPEWLRNNLARENNSNAHSSSSSATTTTTTTTTITPSTSTTAAAAAAAAAPPKVSRPIVKCKGPEYKYERQDILDLYSPQLPAPENLKSNKALYIPTSQIPEVLQRRSRNIRHTMHGVPADFRPSNRTGFRDFNRPMNSFQPRWSMDNSTRRQYINKIDNDENWRVTRPDILRKWNEKPREHRDIQGSASNYPDERNSPDDSLPEWANSEDTLDEAGSFDATGAFLPVLTDEKENILEIQIEKPESPVMKSETEIDNEERTIIVENLPISPVPLTFTPMTLINETKDDIDILSKTIKNVKLTSDIEDSSFFMEDYLNKLVQEDEVENNKSKERDNLVLDDNKLFNQEKPPPLNNQMVFNLVSQANIPNIPFKEPTIPLNLWYYQDKEIHGPYTNAEMRDFVNLNIIDSFTPIRKGNSGPFLALGYLYEIFSGVSPFVQSDVVINKVFTINEKPPTFVPGSFPPRFFDPITRVDHKVVERFVDEQLSHIYDSPDFSIPPMPPLEQYNTQMADIVSNNRINTNSMHGAMRMPFMAMPPRVDDIQTQMFQNQPPPHRLENPMMYPSPNFRNPEPPQERNLPNNWNLPNYPKMSWMDPLTHGKAPYVPIPMPASATAHNPPIVQENVTPVMNRFMENFMSPPPLPNMNLLQENLVTSKPPPPVPQQILQNPLEGFDYSSHMGNQIDVQKMFQHSMYMTPPPPIQQPMSLYSKDESAQYPMHDINIAKDMGMKVDKMFEALDQARKENEAINKAALLKKKTEEFKLAEAELHRNAPFNTTNHLNNMQAIQQHIDLIRLHKPQQHLQSDPHGSNAHFSWNVKKQTMPNAPNFKQLIDAQRMEKQIANQLAQQHQQQKILISNQAATVNHLSKDKYPWSAHSILQPPKILTLSEIQNEQFLRQMKKSNTNTLPSANFHQNIWNSTTEKKMPTMGGFWDIEKNRNKMKETDLTNNNNTIIENNTLKNTVLAPKQDKVATLKVIPLKRENVEDKLLNEKQDRDEALVKFISWAKTELNGRAMGDTIDVDEFVNFMSTVESPYEVEEYTKIYLGDTKNSSDFAKVFIQRRSQMIFNKSRSIPCDDLCSPARAYNPSIDKREEAKNKNKKKKGKMSKVDARILGFNATAAENRFNIGNIESSP